VENTIQRQADAPAGSHQLDPDADTSGIELLDDTSVNGSGESAASAEAISRQASMKAAGEQFAVMGPGGQVRPLIGPEAVDYQPRPNERFGKVGKDGRFQALSLMAPAAAPLIDTGDPELDATLRTALMGAGAAGVGMTFLKNGNQVKTFHQWLPKGFGSLAGAIRKTKEGYEVHPRVIERLRGFYTLGKDSPTPANWTGNREALLESFDGNEGAYNLFGKQWAATSPNTDVVNNTHEALSVQEHALRNAANPELDLDTARYGLTRSITMAEAKVPNINRAFRGEALTSGDDIRGEKAIGKVNAMGKYMVGEEGLPADTHFLHMSGAETDKFDTEIPQLRKFFAEREGLGRGGLTKTDIYNRVEGAFIPAYKSLDPDRSFNAIFGDAWEGTRIGKGLPWQGGPTDILKGMGLDERGALNDADRIRAALRKAAKQPK
jgi:hypothetical protein